MSKLEDAAKAISPAIAQGIAYSQALPLLAKYAPDIEQVLHQAMQEAVNTDEALLRLQAVTALPNEAILRLVEEYQAVYGTTTLRTLEWLTGYYAIHGRFPNE